MTEQDWLECEAPTPMLEIMGGKASDRKSGLIACACCRRIWQLLRDNRSKQAVEAAEQYADGLLDKAELGTIGKTADEAVKEWAVWGWFAAGAASSAAMLHFPDRTVGNCFSDSVNVVRIPTNEAASDTARGAALTVASFAYWTKGSDFDASENLERAQQVILLRDIFGNPFRPVACKSAWRTPEVVVLAQSIYDDRAFDQMPILGHALEEAGCDSAEILAHLRGPGPHVRGCWALDLLLGKE